MSNMSRPELVIVPTSFCISSMYDGQVKFLRERGFSVHALDPPSFPARYKPEVPAPSMHDDARFISDFVTKLADEGKDVVILAHSYGGCPVSQAVEGLTKHERATQGKYGGVVRIAYLTAIVPRLGASTLATISASSEGKAPQVVTDQYGWMVQTDPEQTVKMVFNSLPLAEGIAWSAFFGRHAASAFVDPLTYPGYQNVSLALRPIVEGLMMLTSLLASHQLVLL